MTVLIPGLDEEDQRVKITSLDESTGILDSWKTKVIFINTIFFVGDSAAVQGRSKFIVTVSYISPINFFYSFYGSFLSVLRQKILLYYTHFLHI